MSDPLKRQLVLLVALLHGLVYLVLIPPWQHYDEPTHFEYAWLIANHNQLPAVGTVDNGLRREVAASMLEYNFYWNVPRPDLLTDVDEISIGVSELVHPPAYYLLVSIPLRFARHLDVASQLYVARVVSLVLFLCTIAVVTRLVSDLTPPGHHLRWAVPLTAALLPPLVDVMTAVNNDVGAVLVVSLFLWASVRTIRFGVNFARCIALISISLLAISVKNTAAVALILVPVVLLFALWLRRGWAWRWLLVAAGGTLAIALIAAFEWGDAAYWYRWQQTTLQVSPTRVSDVKAPIGDHAFTVETTPGNYEPYLVSPISAEDVRRVAGSTVTIGGWVWADRPATLEGPALLLSGPAATTFEPVLQPITVTTEPTFVTWTFVVPRETKLLHYALMGQAIKQDDRPLLLQLDGAILVPGQFPPDTAPSFDDASARTGSWAGQRFVNLVRNPSAEAGWPRLRPWLERAVVRYARRSPAQVITALLDIERTGGFLVGTSSLAVLYGHFTGFAWGHIRLAGGGWNGLFAFLGLVALAGCARWLLSSKGARTSVLAPVLAFLGLAGIVIWTNTILRPLPLLVGKVALPAARYAFPAVIPTVLGLSAGWWAIMPRRYRLYGTLLLLLCLLVIDSISIWMIWRFYRSLPLP